MVLKHAARIVYYTLKKKMLVSVDTVNTPTKKTLMKTEVLNV